MRTGEDSPAPHRAPCQWSSRSTCLSLPHTAGPGSSPRPGRSWSSHSRPPRLPIFSDGPGEGSQLQPGRPWSPHCSPDRNCLQYNLGRTAWLCWETITSAWSVSQDHTGGDTWNRAGSPPGLAATAAGDGAGGPGAPLGPALLQGTPFRVTD